MRNNTFFTYNPKNSFFVFFNAYSTSSAQIKNSFIGNPTACITFFLIKTDAELADFTDKTSFSS